MREYCTQFETALRDDNYAQITVNNDVEYRKIVNNFPVHKRSLEQVIKIQNAMFSMISMQEPYPRKFPFSQFVPTVFLQAKSYCLGCLRFMHDLQLTRTDVNDTVRRYANVLLDRWSASLRQFVNQKQCTLVQVWKHFISRQQTRIVNLECKSFFGNALQFIIIFSLYSKP